MEDQDEFEEDGFMVEYDPLANRRMIILKVIGDDIHAEDNDGQMMIVRGDGSVSSFLNGDTDWVHGELSPAKNGEYWEGTAWDVIGFHFGMTNGEKMERARNGATTH